MDLMEQLLAELGKLPDGTADEVKSGIKELFQTVSKKAGKASTDLEVYKKGHTDYQKMVKRLTDQGVDPENFDAFADELGIKKTLQDELEITKLANKDLASKYKEMEKTILRNKMESVLGKRVDEAAKAYTTVDGKKIAILDDFIDKSELFKPLDLENDVLVQDRVKRILDTAFTTQSNIMKKLGADGVSLHKVPEGEGSVGSAVGPVDTNQVRGIMSKSNGSLDAAAQALTMYDSAKK
jgi:hypothetical protein